MIPVLLSIFILLISFWIAYSEEYAEKNSQETIVPVINSDNTDELLKFKKMYDDGIITEEEFLIVKKELLK